MEIWGYDGKHPDNVHDDIAAVVVILLRQGLDAETIERGVLKRYGETVDVEAIRKSIPYYLGRRKGYAPNKKVIAVRDMLSGRIP